MTANDPERTSKSVSYSGSSAIPSYWKVPVGAAFLSFVASSRTYRLGARRPSLRIHDMTAMG